MMVDLSRLTTEQRNPATMDLDQMSPLEIAAVMNQEDKKAVLAVQQVLPQVATAIQWAADSLRQGGRLIYMGAGTSGRLGVLDAVEVVRNWLPRPSPLDAPLTRPAISTNSMVVGRIRCGLTISASLSRRGSGIGTTPVFGSMVQKGKLAASIPALVSALNRVDLPTLGKPTIPHLNPMI